MHIKKKVTYFLIILFLIATQTYLLAKSDDEQEPENIDVTKVEKQRLKEKKEELKTEREELKEEVKTKREERKEELKKIREEAKEKFSEEREDFEDRLSDI